MTIVQTISTVGQFRDAFERVGRRTQFSRDALGLLFDYFDSVDDNVELDVVAICCEFAESTADEVRDSYDVPANTNVDDFLSDNTTLIGQTDAGAFVYVQF